jgi:epoxide hydrolase-like predicted phosphatase
MASEEARGRAYRGLLVDYGGVLTTDLFASFNAFCEQEGLEPGEIGRRFREDRASRELLISLETGVLPEQEFELQLGALLGVSGPGLIERMFAGSSPDEQMLDAVGRARSAGIRTGLVSNSWSISHYDREQLATLFDAVLLSGEIGIRKPSPEIYTLGAEQIGVEPGACVFVDDLPFNLEPAEALGMATVHHMLANVTIAELERLLRVKLR